MVEWSCTKERINERGQDILVEWSCANKRSKSMRTQFFYRMVVHNRKNEWKWTIYFVFSFLVLQKKTITRVESKISSFLFLVLIKGITRKRYSKIPLPNPSIGKLPLRPSVNCNKLLGRGISRTLSNIYDGAFLRK